MHTVVFRLVFSLFKLLPLNEKKIVFVSDRGDTLFGNAKFVYDELLRRQLDFTYWFLLKKNSTERKTAKEHILLAYHFATASIIIVDDVYSIIYPLKLRDNTELVQLWHAVGAFKTFGYSRVGRPGGPSIRSKAHRNYTKAIVSSKTVAKHYAEGFGISIDKVVATGIPRTDIFFDRSYGETVKKKLYDKYPYLKTKKVILYAPTFRGAGQANAHFPFAKIEFDRLYNQLRDDYVFLFKMHPFVKKQLSIPDEYKGFFYDMSSYPDINDLLFITDIVVTDYSSVCFEAALLRIPMLFFAFDVEAYTRSRDFYYRYESFIPGPLVKDTDELIQSVIGGNFNFESIDEFVNYFFDHTDGKSSQRVVNQIILGKGAETSAVSGATSTQRTGTKDNSVSW
ncbi:CDP-glycerol glycerophosphotransferase family protein [Alicyclobacillus sp. SO9]|nr:CDP-glycerol glycerophosphotransferase family protein [Alicyclobacillus sp. SO9]